MALGPYFESFWVTCWSFGVTFCALGVSLGPPWGTLGPRPLKRIKKITFWDLILGSVFEQFCTFLGRVVEVKIKSPVDHVFQRFLTHFLITLAPKMDQKVVPAALPKNTHHFDGAFLFLFAFCEKVDGQQTL